MKDKDKKDKGIDIDDALNTDPFDVFGDLDVSGSGPKIDLQPFVDADDEITVETCLHINKRWVVQGVNLKYWYCPECKKEIKDCLPPKGEN